MSLFERKNTKNSQMENFSAVSEYSTNVITWSYDAYIKSLRKSSVGQFNIQK